MTELTEAEVERLARHWFEGDRVTLYGNVGHWDDEDERHAYIAAVRRVAPAFADLIDARLAPIRALAEQWATDEGEPLSVDGLTALTVTNRLGRTLRAALSADLTAPQPTSGTEGHSVGCERWRSAGDWRECNCSKKETR